MYCNTTIGLLWQFYLEPPRLLLQFVSLTIPLNNRGMLSDSLTSQDTLTLVVVFSLSLEGISVIILVPIIGPSLSVSSIDFLGYNTTVWRPFKPLRPTATSLSMTLPFLLTL